MTKKTDRRAQADCKMFPSQEKIELFARKNYFGWDNWGLEIPDSKIEILTGTSKDAEAIE